MVTQTGLVIVLVILALGIGAAALIVALGRGGGLGLVQQQLDALRAEGGQALGGQAELLGQQIARLTVQVDERLRERCGIDQRSYKAAGAMDRAHVTGVYMTSRCGRYI